MPTDSKPSIEIISRITRRKDQFVQSVFSDRSALGVPHCETIGHTEILRDLCAYEYSETKGCSGDWWRARRKLASFPTKVYLAKIDGSSWEYVALKVCYINYLSPVLVHGGAERVVLEEAKAVVDSGNEAFIVSLKYGNEARKSTHLYEGRIRNLLIPCTARIPTSFLCKGVDILSSFWNPVSTLYLGRILKLEQPDIVHVHQLGSMSLCSLRSVSRLGFKVVRTFHGYYFECVTGSLSRRSGVLCDNKHIACRVYENLYFKLTNYSDMIIAISPYVKMRLEESGYDPRRIRMIPNGIDIKSTTPIPRGYGPMKILFVGRMTKVKGLDVLLGALSTIEEQYTIDLVGTGEHLEYFRSQAKQLGVRARFRGKVSDEALAELYERADVVVVPSIFPELCSMVILEAMSYGKPVIASDLGGNRHLVLDGRTGYLFEAGNEEQLADLIRDLIHDETKAMRMGERGMDSAQKFSAQNHGRLLLDAYSEVLRHGKSR